MRHPGPEGLVRRPVAKNERYIELLTGLHRLLNCLSSCQWVGVCHQTPRDWPVGWQWPDASNVLYTKTFTWVVRCRASGSEFPIKPWGTGTPARQCQWPDTNIVWYCVIYKDLNLRCLPSCQWVGVCHQFPEGLVHRLTKWPDANIV